MNNTYAAYNKIESTRLNGSSGGLFAAIADHFICNDGIVFGAVFDDDFNVVIKSTDRDITSMMGAKYTKAKTGSSYKECKEYLDSGRVVLYAGTPCQIYGLKGFLKKDYSNLYTVDIFCHGTPSASSWQRYLKSLGKPIQSVNFRDKRNGWTNYGISIKFTDGTELYEHHNDNRYMKLFLSNNILNTTCFNCQYRAHSHADISIGDLWGHEQLGNQVPQDNKGLSAVVVHTDKGQYLLEQLDIVKTPISYDFIKKNNCIDMSLPKPPTHDFYTKLVTSPKIGIVTDQVYKNVGGILQAVALSDCIERIMGIKPFVVNQLSNGHLEYFDKYCQWTTSSVDESFSIMVVGSDQIWNHRAAPLVPFNDKYCIHPTIKKIVYAASFGHHECLYTTDEVRRIQDALRQVPFISTRELTGQYLAKQWFKVDSTPVLDPTMLYDADFYCKTIDEGVSTEFDGIFAYILDDSPAWQTTLDALAKNLGTTVLPFDGSCEQFIHNMNAAKYVITDSYHGSVFSLIFNKPFITYRNVARGNDRFDDLCVRFKPIKGNFVTSIENIPNQVRLLETKPNVQPYIEYFRKGSIDFLKQGLFQL